MNTKQKLFTFTSIGAVFATAIAFVAITGARNLEQLKADEDLDILTITFDAGSMASNSENDDVENIGYVNGSFTLNSKTEKQELPFSNDVENTTYYCKKGAFEKGSKEKGYIFKLTDTSPVFYLDYKTYFTLTFTFFEGPAEFYDATYSYKYEGDSKEYNDGQFTYAKDEFGRESFFTYYGAQNIGEVFMMTSITIQYVCGL